MERRWHAPHASAIGFAIASAMLAGVLFTSAPARAEISVRIDIGNAPPPPIVVFHARPHERFYWDNFVSVIDDPYVGNYDCFHYGGYYWLFSDGFWYRTRDWRHEFVVVHPSHVPNAFYKMSPKRWKHHPTGPPGYHRNAGYGPPGQQKKDGGQPPGQSKKDGEGHGKSGGNDKSNGHGGK